MNSFAQPKPKRAVPAGAGARANVAYRSLAQVKQQAVSKASAARAEPVADVREAFGFMPVGIQGVVIRWRGL